MQINLWDETENMVITRPSLFPAYIIWATSWENLFMPDANNKGADQPAHQCSLISAFVVCCLDSITPLVSITKNFPLPSFCSWAGQFQSTLVANPEDRFSRDEAHLLLTTYLTSVMHLL